MLALEGHQEATGNARFAGEMLGSRRLTRHPWYESRRCGSRPRRIKHELGPRGPLGPTADGKARGDRLFEADRAGATEPRDGGTWDPPNGAVASHPTTACSRLKYRELVPAVARGKPGVLVFEETGITRHPVGAAAPDRPTDRFVDGLRQLAERVASGGIFFREGKTLLSSSLNRFPRELPARRGDARQVLRPLLAEDRGVTSRRRCRVAAARGSRRRTARYASG